MLMQKQIIGRKERKNDNTIYLLKLIIMRSVCDADYASEHYEFSLCVLMLKITISFFSNHSFLHLPNIRRSRAHVIIGVSSSASRTRGIRTFTQRSRIPSP